MASDHILYLTNTGNIDIYPDNNPAGFINTLATPIVLENNREYEVGLVSILYPDRYYGVLADNEDYNILVKTYQRMTASTLTVKFHRHILAGDMERIVKVVNKNIKQYLEAYYESKFKDLFPHGGNILDWDDSEKRVEIQCINNRITTGVARDIDGITVKIQPGLAKILGFNTDVAYEIFNNKKAPNNIHRSSKAPSPRCGVDYIYLYTDIVQPSNFGGQLVNILDCFSLQNGGNRGIHNSIYKPLNTCFIDKISIAVRDQYARPIRFVEESSLTCAIHIRPK